MLDFSTWDGLLRTYVNTRGQVDYLRWKRESESRLSQWLSSLSSSNFQTLEAAEKLALLLNLYNALTIQQVLTKYPINSIRPQVLGIPNWLTFLRFFSKPIYTLNGTEMSLNQLEHGILRQQFAEPRIHFALVCAAVGCPLLRNEAYQPAAVFAQLENDAQRFIQNPNKVRYDVPSKTLYCSKIFKWYGKDFLKVASSVPAYIGSHLATAADLKDDTKIKYLPYDWSLNQSV